MWIALGIIGGLALLITVILTLPVYVTAKDDEQGELMLRYHFLHMTFGEDPDPENPILLYLLDVSGLSRAKTSAIKSNVKTSGVTVTLKDTCNILWSLLEQVVGILPHCKLKRLRLTVVCAADNADEAALHYGQCCAVMYPLIGMIHGLMPVGRRHEYIDIRADFNAFEDEVHYDLKLRTNVCRVLTAFCKIVYKEALRANRDLISAQTHATRRKKRRRKKKSAAR